MVVEAIPHGSGCLLLVTLKEKRGRRIFRIKKRRERLCCVFTDSEALIGAATALLGQPTDRYEVFLFRERYWLISDGSPLPVYPAAVLEEFAEQTVHLLRVNLELLAEIFVTHVALGVDKIVHTLLDLGIVEIAEIVPLDEGTEINTHKV